MATDAFPFGALFSARWQWDNNGRQYQRRILSKGHHQKARLSPSNHGLRSQSLGCPRKKWSQGLQFGKGRSICSFATSCSNSTPTIFYSIPTTTNSSNICPLSTHYSLKISKGSMQSSHSPRSSPLRQHMGTILSPQWESLPVHVLARQCLLGRGNICDMDVEGKFGGTRGRVAESCHVGEGADGGVEGLDAGERRL